MRKYLLSVLESRELTKLETLKNIVTTRKSTFVDVDQDELPKKYLVKKVDYKPDKKTLKELLESGKRIRGAELKQRINLYVK